MMISTRGRYALRVMIDLAEHKEQYVAMKDVAQRQDLSLKYLEKILPALTKSDYVVGIHGKGGGYKLTKEPKDYKVGDILRVTEKTFVPVACLENTAEECAHLKVCKTRPLWEKLSSIVNDYLDSITLEDLMNNKI